MTTRTFFVTFLVVRSLVFVSYCGLALSAYFSQAVEPVIFMTWLGATGLLQIIVHRVGSRWLTARSGTNDQFPAC